MRRLAAAVVVTAMFGLAVAAQAIPPVGDWESFLNADCTVFHEHSGFIPGYYDVAVFIEEGYGPDVVETGGQDIYVAPPEGRKSWDTVHKCKYRETTTSTLTSFSTTTTSLSSSTTGPEPTSTTSNPTVSTTGPSSPSTSSTSPTATSLPPATSTSAPTELPFTGANTALILLSGLSLVAVGGLLVRNRSDA